MTPMGPFWAEVGPVLAGLSSLLIAFMGRSWGAIPDLIYVALVLLCIGSRWMDSEEQQVPREAYCVGVALVAIPLWALVRVISLAL